MIISLAQHLAECRLTCDDPRFTEEHFPLTGEPADLSKMLVIPQRHLGFTMREMKRTIAQNRWRSANLLELFRRRRSILSQNEGALVALGAQWDSGSRDGYRYLSPFICQDELQLVCTSELGPLGYEMRWPDFAPGWDFYSMLLVQLDQ